MNNAEIVDNASKVLEAIDAAKEEELRNLNTLVQPRAPLNAGSTPGEIISEIKHLSTRDPEGGEPSEDKTESGTGRTTAEGAAQRDHKYSRSRPKKPQRSGLQSGTISADSVTDGEGRDSRHRESNQYSDGDGHSDSKGTSTDLASIQPCEADDVPCSSTSHLEEEGEMVVRPKILNKPQGLIESKEDEDEMLSELQEQRRGRSKRLSALGRVNPSPIPSPRPDELLKKGIGESIAWSGQMMESSLSHGAIQCVPKSDHSPSGRSVFVAAAHLSAQSACWTPSNDMQQNLAPISSDTSTDNASRSELRTIEEEDYFRDDDFDQYDDEGNLDQGDWNERREDHNNSLFIRILKNQEEILSRLKTIGSIQESLDSIKRIQSKQGLALSTLEGMLSSVMIAIPGSGNPGGSVEVNPDLKPMLGRNKNRALKEVSDELTPPNQFLQKQGLTIQQVVKPKDKMFPPAIQPGESSAKGFHPKDNVVSRTVINSIISARVTNPELAAKLKLAVAKAQTKEELEKIHKSIIKNLKN